LSFLFIINLKARKRWLPPPPPPPTGSISADDSLIVDIGAGAGINSKALLDLGFNMLSIEPSPYACAIAVQSGLKNVICGSIDETLKSNSLGDSLLLDVIEHIEDDLDFLKLLSDKMKNAGRLIIMVPASMVLWRSSDEYLRHFRRYLRKDLENKLIEAGFHILNSSYFFSFAYFPILFIAILEKLGLIKKQTQMPPQESAQLFKKRACGSKFTRFLIGIINKIEIFLVLRGIRIPFGSSIIIMAENQK
jgi:SAM-dependent methyltransferase